MITNFDTRIRGALG